VDSISLGSQVVQYIFAGLTVGAIYALVALGFNIIYNVTEVINFAQGEFVVWGGLILAVLAESLGIPLFFSFFISVGLVSLVGTVIYWAGIRPLRQPTILTMIMATIAISIILKGLAMFIWGKDPYAVQPFVDAPPVTLWGAYIQPQTFWVLGISVALVVVLTLFFQHTLTGKAMRACADNPGAASLVGIMAGMALAAGLAYGVGLPALRLKGHYLAMATLGFGMIVYIVFNEFIGLTGGPSGFGEIPPIHFLGIEISSTLGFYYLVWTLAVGILWISLNIVHSRPGRALRAIHDSEKAAAAVGIDITRAKVQIFVVSGVYGALAGSLYAHFVTFINPPPFDIFFSIKVLMMVVIGGIGSIWGAYLGAALLTFLPEWLAFLEDFDVLAYGIILLAIVMFSPDGMVGLGSRVMGRIRNMKNRGR